MPHSAFVLRGHDDILGEIRLVGIQLKELDHGSTQNHGVAGVRFIEFHALLAFILRHRDARRHGTVAIRSVDGLLIQPTGPLDGGKGHQCQRVRSKTTFVDTTQTLARQHSLLHANDGRQRAVLFLSLLDERIADIPLCFASFKEM